MIFDKDKKMFSSPNRPDRPTQPPTPCVPGDLSSMVKRPEHEAEHSCVSVKRAVSPLAPPYAFMASVRRTLPLF
jgi:hypothetical protein